MRSSISCRKLVVQFLLLSFLSLPGTLIAQGGDQGAQIPNEVAVTADAWAWAPPDHVRLTILLRASGATAGEAQAIILEKEGKIVQALKQLAPDNFQVLPRGDKFTAGEKGAAIAKNSPITVERYLGIETAALNKAAQLVDAALNAGGESVTDVLYLVKNDASLNELAMQDATKKARGKAEAIAKSLGVQLGPLLSATVSEEPAGRIIREKFQRGVELEMFGDNDMHVFVSLRFGIEKGA